MRISQAAIESIKKSPFFKKEHEKRFFQSLSKLPRRSQFDTFSTMLSNSVTNYRLYRRKTYNLQQFIYAIYDAIKGYLFPQRFDASMETVSWLLNIDGTLKGGIKEVLEKEEKSFHKTMENGHRVIRKYWQNIAELTGEDLSWLHETHGIDCSVVEDYFNQELTDAQFSDYQKCYELHKTTGGRGYKPKVIQMICN